MTTMLCVVSLQQQIAMGNGGPINYSMVWGKVDFLVHISQIFTLSLYFFFFFFFFRFLSRPSSAFDQLVFHSGPGGPLEHLLCRGLSQCPFFVFPTRWLWWGLNPRPSDYQADLLPPDHPPYVYSISETHLVIAPLIAQTKP